MQQIHVCKDPLIFCCYPEVSFKQCMEPIKKRVQAVRERQQSLPEVIPVSPIQICQSPASCWPVQWPGTLCPRASACSGCKAWSRHVSLTKKPFLRRGSFPSACSANDWPWDERSTRNEGCPQDGRLSHKVPQGAASLQLCQGDQVRGPAALPTQPAEAAFLFESLLISPVSTSPCKWKIIIEKNTFRKSKTFLRTFKPKCEH